MVLASNSTKSCKLEIACRGDLASRTPVVRTHATVARWAEPAGRRVNSGQSVAKSHGVIGLRLSKSDARMSCSQPFCITNIQFRNDARRSNFREIA